MRFEPTNPGRRVAAAPLSALLAAALLLTLACGRDGGAPSSAGSSVTVETAEGAPLILISIDTLRSDRLPIYGYDGIETPAIDRLAADSIVYEHAYSHYPITLPSHTSLFSGLLPPDHGVRDNIGYAVEADAMPWLPRDLQQAGYRTGGLVSSFVLRGDTGFDTGFDDFDDDIAVRRDIPLGGLQRSGFETLERTVDWLDTVGEQPFFLFFHIYEPHSPYTPPEPFASRYPDPYDGEVAAADAVVGGLLDALRERDLYDDAVIVLLSDHGEGLGDHGEQEHGIFLYREAIQVALVLKLPGAQLGGARVAAPAQLIDVPPTVRGLLGLPPQPADDDRPTSAPSNARSLLDLFGPDAPNRRIFSETFYPRLHLGWSDLSSLVDAEYHYIDGPAPELYDVVADPAQRNDILRERRRVYAEKREAIAGYQVPLAGPSDVDPEAVAKLAALGYAGSPSVAEGDLPDPKSRLHELEALKEASALIGAKRWIEAVPVLEQLVAANEFMQDAREKLALALHRSGQRAAAVAAYRDALERSGGASHLALTLAGLYLELGAFDDAREHAALALDASPALAHLTRAEIEMAAESIDAARQAAEQAVAADDTRPMAHVMLARVLARQNDLDAAAQSMARADALFAEQSSPLPVGAAFAKGDLAARQGRAADAAAAFQDEIARHPDHLDSYTRLAILLVAEGDPQSGIGVLRQMLEVNPVPGAHVQLIKTLRILGDPQSADRALRQALTQFPDDRALLDLRAG
ncbi:MAG: sulfatase-like hydrolase/transferase [Acidobacteriota bacterium]